MPPPLPRSDMRDAQLYALCRILDSFVDLLDALPDAKDGVDVKDDWSTHLEVVAAAAEGDPHGTKAVSVGVALESMALSWLPDHPLPAPITRFPPSHRSNGQTPTPPSCKLQCFELMNVHVTFVRACT